MSVLWKKPIMDHIVWYKEHIIKCREMGQWDGVSYRHIFPPDKTDMNFIDGCPPADRCLKTDGGDDVGAGPILRHAGYDHMNSAQVMGLNIFPHIFGEERNEQALLASLQAQGIPSMGGRAITAAWLEEPVGGDDGPVAELCLRLDDGQKFLIALFYYNFKFGPEKDMLLNAAAGKTHSVFVLLRQNTLLNPDYELETEIGERENSANLHVLYWEKWLPCLISLLDGNPKEYCKEIYRKNLDF